MLLAAPHARRHRLSAGRRRRPLADGQRPPSRAITPIALSLWGTFVPTGIALAGLVAAGFADAGWRTIFAVDLVLLAAAVIVAVVAVPRDRRRRRAASEKPPAGALAASLPLASPSSASPCSSWRSPDCCRPGWSSAVAGGRRRRPHRRHRHRLRHPGSLLAGSLMRLGVSPGRLAAIGLLGSMALAALCFTALPLPLAVVGFALSFAIGGLVPAATFASVPLVAANPRAIGPINGLVAQAGSLGSLAGPPLLAAVGRLDRTGRSRRCCCSRLRCSARPRRSPSASLDALLHHHEPRLAGERHQPAARIDRDRGSWSRCSSRCRRSPARSRRARR